MPKKVIITAIILLFAVSMTTPGYCDDALKKLGRGLCNIATCPLELPKQTSDVSNAEGPMAGLTYGVVKGLGMIGVRAVVGVYETVTFLIPFPRYYKPILTDPEFFLEDKNW